MNVFRNHLAFFVIKKYKAKSVIFTEGHECQHLGIVLKGEIEISTTTYLQKEFSIKALGPDDIFGENLLFSSGGVYLGNVISKTDSEIALIGKADLLKLLSSDPTLLEDYLRALSDSHMLLQQKIKILSQKSVAEKIMFYLGECSKKIHSLTIPLKSKEHLAAYLNIPRPSLSRELISLKNEGMIDYNRHSITILKNQ